MAKLIRRSKLIDGVPPKSYYVPGTKRERMERHAERMRARSKTLWRVEMMREVWRKRKEGQ